MFVLVCIAAVFIPLPAGAQAKEIIAEGTYNMGDGETPSAAESRALLNAKRDALEQAGTYVRSYTKVKNATLTEDEIEVIASGIMDVSVIDKKRTVIGDGFKFWVKIQAVVQMEKIDEMAKRVKDRQVVEDYKRIKEAYDNSRQEIEELKKKLAEAKNEASRQAVVASITEDEQRLKATQWVDAGQRHVQSEDYDKAIEDVNKAIALTPDDAYVYYFRGLAYSKKGQDDRATEDFNMGISLKPDDAFVYFSRGDAYLGKGQYDRAIEDFNKGISLQPDFAFVYFSRGLAYSKKGQDDRAIEDFNKGISLQPDFAYFYFYRGVAYSKKGQDDRAIEDYNKAISLKPDFASFYGSRGSAYVGKGQHDMAIKDFNKAIALKPDYAEAYSGRGFAYILEFKNFVQGCADLKLACALGDCEGYEMAKKKGDCK